MCGEHSYFFVFDLVQESISLCFVLIALHPLNPIFFYLQSQDAIVQPTADCHKPSQHLIMYLTVKQHCPTVSKVQKFHCMPALIFGPLLFFVIVLLAIYIFLMVRCFRNCLGRSGPQTDAPQSA